jgi:capsular exopolysaccharide synthesis family protein
LRYKIEGHEDVVKLTKIPIIADIPIAKTQKSRGDIVVHENKNSQMEEVFRSLRTNLQFVIKNTDKVIIFTSTTSGEGKTFTASNLAISFALLGKKVLIIGLDIRKPRLGQLFELHGHGRGITTFLCADNPDKELIKEQIIKSEINENLDLILAGPIPPNPAELLARNSLDKAIEYLKEDYDYIFLDTAPVGMVSDTLLISRVADSTVFLCKADYTPKASFGLVNSLYDEEKLPNINIVLNGVDMMKKKYGYYYGYGKYGRYSHYGSHYGYGYGYGYGGTYGDIDNISKEEEDNTTEKEK